jgi:hypothetical protein
LEPFCPSGYIKEHILGGIRVTGIDLNFDLGTEEELHCPNCGKALLSSDLERSSVMLRCKCGKVVRIRAENGIVIMAAMMRAGEAKDSAAINAS